MEYNIPPKNEEEESNLSWDSKQYFVDLVAKNLWMIIPAAFVGLIMGLCIGTAAIFLFRIPYFGKRRRKKDKRCVFFVVKERNNNIAELPQSDLQCVTHL